MKNGKFIILFFLFSLLYANINQKIIKFYKSYYPNIEIENIKIIPTPPKKYKTLKIMLSPKKTSGNIKIDNKFYYVKIKAKIPVCIATTIIKTNEDILNKCKIKKIPFRNFYSKPITNINSNIVASKIISKNSIINQSNTKKKPLVFKNSDVSVIIQSKNINISTTAKALEDGYKGDEIKILLNKKIKKAIVIDKGAVTIKWKKF